MSHSLAVGWPFFIAKYNQDLNKEFMIMYVYYNPNPTGRTKVGDCSVRAISKALDTSWDDAYDLLCTAGKRMGDMPSSNEVIGAVLRQTYSKESG